ncbi:MAG: DUF1972 domain-containing protein [Streptococcaceae bacterium]|nr:DUF1972 domain-containing protein [Streptococcaceae bacterium]
MKHVFIIGSRGLPAQYGGFETFVEQLVINQKNKNINYHVACQSENSDLGNEAERCDYHGADCFKIKVPSIGSARVIAYDIKAINKALEIIKVEQIEQPIFYILGNTIGGLIGRYVKKIHAVGGQLFVNPDGLEWKRTKWSAPVRSYLKLAEKKMVQQSDLIISDNEGIKDYLMSQYENVKTKVIAYGTETASSDLTQSTKLEEFNIQPDNYYLIVGRFVPENNYETLIKGFMESSSQKDLIIVTSYQDNSYFDQLRQITGFDKDKRIKFVGSIYDKSELTYIRKQAFAYLHGHEVGGTNPGLLEAMWSTPLNIVLSIDFNRKVAGDSALYFTKEGIAQVFAQAEAMTQNQKKRLHEKAQAIIQEHYTWDKICKEYEELFIES